MPALIQICIVIVTLAFVALVVTTIRTLVRMGAETARLTAAAQLSIGQVEGVVLETRELLASLREMLSPAQRVVNRFQHLGDRVADMSTAVLEEIETPLFTAVAVARGVKIGTARLLDILTTRAALYRTMHNGDQDHE